MIKQLQIAKSAPAVTTATVSTSDELLKLSKLKESGVLTEEEIQSAKKKLLGIQNIQGLEAEGITLTRMA